MDLSFEGGLRCVRDRCAGSADDTNARPEHGHSPEEHERLLISTE